MWPFKKRITQKTPAFHPSPVPPPITPQMRALGFHWKWMCVWQRDEHCGDHKSFTWVEVCDTCGGNCGQCGTSLGMGVPASIDNLLEHLKKTY